MNKKLIVSVLYRFKFKLIPIYQYPNHQLPKTDGSLYIPFVVPVVKKCFACVSLLEIYPLGYTCEIFFCAALLFGHVAMAMFPHRALHKTKFQGVRSKSKFLINSNSNVLLAFYDFLKPFIFNLLFWGY